jgi:HAD superfamily hydrolase (TIGR01549 family)
LKELQTARIWLFDFDNTLVALEPEVDWAVSRVELERYLRESGVDDAIFAEVPKGNLPLYEKLRGRLMDSGGASDAARGLNFNPRTLLESASEIIEAYELRGAEHARELLGASSLLRTLKAQSRPIAIVTSNSSRAVQYWLERHNLLSTVDFIVGRDSMLPLKPAPDMVFRALALTAVNESSAIFVGDSDADAGAARAAGVTFYGIVATVEGRDRLTKKGVPEVFTTPAELARRFDL